MKLKFGKWFLFVPVLAATACSTADRQPMISPAPDNSIPSGDNSTSIQPSSNHFYSFVRSNPADPDGMKSFGADQTTKVLNAVQNVKSRKFSVDAELDPLKIRISNIKEKLAGYSANLKPTDTFVMYSHSHGVIPGLGIDWETRDKQKITYKWEELADAIVNIPAKNVIIFTMSCHSGYLAGAINKISSKWQGQRKSKGRNLIILTAVSTEQLSKPTNQDTSAEGIGNPFSYAVRNALAGKADGAVDGQKDGQTTMAELVKFVLATAKEKSLDQYAEPQFAGEYNENEVFL
jgi:hypothetical protein